MQQSTAGQTQFDSEISVSWLNKRYTMIKNYLTIAIRTMLRNSLFTLINVGKLAIGLSSCIFVVSHKGMTS